MSDQNGNRPTWQSGFGEQGQRQAPHWGQPAPQSASQPSAPEAPQWGQPAQQSGYPGAGQQGYQQNGYAQGYQPAYGHGEPPRKKRGMKRIVFGILGLIANAIGLVAMPLIGGFVGAMIAAFGAMDPDVIDNPATIDVDSASMIMVFAPEGVDPSTCTIDATGADTEVDTNVTGTYTVDLDGTTYAEIAQVTAPSATQLTVDCAGTDTVAYGQGNIMIALITGGVGLAIPVLLGLVALGLLIWGIVARIRS